MRLTWSRHQPQVGEDDDAVLAEARTQITDWFERRRRDFELPMAPHGTDFQLKVWRHIAALPFAATTTYGALADAAGSEPRAVATACGANPLPLVIPCHRIVANDGLGGFSAEGGVAHKQALLTFEMGKGPLVLPVRRQVRPARQLDLGL